MAPESVFSKSSRVIQMRSENWKAQRQPIQKWLPIHQSLGIYRLLPRHIPSTHWKISTLCPSELFFLSMFHSTFMSKVCFSSALSLFFSPFAFKKSLSFPHNHTLNTFTILSVFVGINCDGLIIFVKPLKMKYRHTRHNLSCHLQWQRCWPVSALGIISFSSLNFSSRQATLHDLFLRFYWELNLGRTIIHLGRPTHIDHFSPESPHTNSIGIYANITLPLMYLTNIHWEDTTHWIKYKVIITVLLMPLTS